MIASIRDTNVNWSRALMGYVLRVDVAFGNVLGNDEEDEKELYINEIDIFPIAQTLLNKTSENLTSLIDLSFIAYSQIVKNLEDGKYFCG